MDIIKTSEELIKELQEKLYSQAYSLQQAFYEVHSERSTKKEWGYLGIRVRRIGIGIQIEWYNNYYMKVDGEMKTFSDYIARGRDHTYKISNIKKYKYRRDWEEELIDKIEPQFGLLRKQSMQLTTLGRQMNKIKRDWNL